MNRSRWSLDEYALAAGTVLSLAGLLLGLIFLAVKP